MPDRIEMVRPDDIYEVFTAYRTDWNKRIVVLRFYDKKTNTEMQLDLAIDSAKKFYGYVGEAIKAIDEEDYEDEDL